MFTFGEQLYRLTARDEETLLVDPFFQQLFSFLPGAAVSGQANLAVPGDRCLYLHSLRVVGSAPIAGVTGNWNGFQVRAWTDPAQPPSTDIRIWEVGSGLFNVALAGDGQPALPAALASTFFNVHLGLILPPGIRLLTFDTSTTAKTGDASAFCRLNAYLLPPGRIGRR